jgi:hypothetical protein
VLYRFYIPLALQSFIITGSFSIINFVFSLGDYGEYEYDENRVAVPPHAPSSSLGVNAPVGGLQLTGLLCPTCRLICHGVEALKEHMATVHGLQQLSQQPQLNQRLSLKQQPPMHLTPKHQQTPKSSAPKEVGENSVICHICDKVFQVTLQ